LTVIRRQRACVEEVLFANVCIAKLAYYVAILDWRRWRANRRHRMAICRPDGQGWKSPATIWLARLVNSSQTGWQIVTEAFRRSRSLRTDVTLAVEKWGGAHPNSQYNIVQRSCTQQLLSDLIDRKSSIHL